MSRRSRICIGLAISAFLAAGASGQLAIPAIVQLPNTDHFVWPWGETRPVDDPDRPDFNISGGEAAFRCTARGSFKPGSHMRDYYNLRDFEQSLNGTLYFIQETTAALNTLDLGNELQWALLECAKPETTEAEDETQERIDRAVERAARDRERRREREARSQE